MTELIMVKKTEHIAIITLNRPEARNALSSEVLKILQHEIDSLHADTSIRAVIITGSSDKAFCAGADLKERQGMNEPEVINFVQTIQAVFQSIATLPMPTLAALNGDAFGGGLELALACDLRVATQAARMGLSECALGIIPGAGGTQRLPRIVGVAAASELIFMAKIVNAEQALAMGLVNQIAKDGISALACAQSMATVIANNAPLAIRAAKRAMMPKNELTDGLAAELRAYESIVSSQDRLEGLKAFHEKRRPIFIGS